MSLCVFVSDLCEVLESNPAVSPTVATAKKLPKYFRNSLDQAICIAICRSLIWFCIRIWRSIWAHARAHTDTQK